MAATVSHQIILMANNSRTVFEVGRQFRAVWITEHKAGFIFTTSIISNCKYSNPGIKPLAKWRQSAKNNIAHLKQSSLKTKLLWRLTANSIRRCVCECVCGQRCSKLESFLCVFSIRCCLYLFECFDNILHALLLAGINILVGLNINLASELGLEHYCSFTAEPP